MRAMTWPFLTRELKSTNSSLIWPETWLPTWTVMTALRVPLADTAAVRGLARAAPSDIWVGRPRSAHRSTPRRRRRRRTRPGQATTLASAQDTKSFVEHDLGPVWRGGSLADNIALRAVQALQGPVEGEIDHGVLATRRDVHAQELLGGAVQGVERAKVPERQPLERNDEPRDVSAGIAHIILIQIDGRRARTAQDHVLRDVAAMPATAFDGREGGCCRVELLE